MARDIAELGVKIDTRDVKKGDEALDKFAKQADKAEKSTGNLEGAAKGLGKAFAGVAAIVGALDLASKLIESQRAFDKLNASLITATGSAGNAATAFGALQRFAATTPYGLQDVTKAFIQLRNLGLTPSERALTSYGNTASAMGKSLNQLVEAVADAATGEFERLKEFGIRARQQGDTVALTFQGTTTTVKNNAAAIEGYLMQLGETKFAGGMELQAKTLDGAISNLADTWAMTVLAFSQSGFGDAVASGVVALTNALTDLQAILQATGLAANEEKKAIEEAGFLHKTLTTVFETFAVIGEQVAFTFRAIGREIGGIAAQAAAVLTGNFAGAKAIRQQMISDAAEDRRLTDARIEKILWASAVAEQMRKNEREAKERDKVDELERFKVLSDGTTQLTAAQKKAAEDALSWYNKTAEAGEDQIALLNAELNSTDALTDGQKNAIKVLGDLVKFSGNLTAAQKQAIAANIEEALRLERLTAARKADEKAAEDRAAAIKKDTDAAWARVAELQKELDTYGMTAEAVLRLTLAEYQRQTQAAELNEEEAARLNNLIAATEKQIDLQGKLGKAQEATKFWTDIESTARQTFLSIADGGKSAAERLKSSFKNIFFDWLYQMTLKKWIINIGTAVSGTAGVSGIANAATTGVAGGIAQQAGSALGLGGLFGGMSGFGSGLSSGLSAWGAEGSVTGLLNSGALFGGGLANGLGAIVGSLGPVVLGVTAAVKLLDKAFGRGPKTTTGQGITGMFGAEGFTNGQNYTNWTKKGGWFSSSKSGTDTSPIDAALAMSLNDSFKMVKDATSAFAESLGLPTDTITGYTKALNLALTGDTAKDQAAFAKLFEDIGDELATGLIPNMAEFAKQGESASSTLQRLAQNFQVTDAWLVTFGKTSEQVFGALGIASAEARTRLVELSGGIDSFASQTAFFAQNFLTKAEQIAPVQKMVTDQLAALGYAGLTTNEQFKAAVLGLINSGALATEAGAKTYAGLLALAPAFKQLTDYLAETGQAAETAAQKLARLKEEAAALMGSVDANLSTVRAVVERDRAVIQSAYEKTMAALQERIDSVTKSVSRLTSLSQLLHSTLDGMRVPGQQVADRLAAQAQIKAALAIANAGGAVDQGMLQNALSTISQDASDSFTTFAAYQRDYVRTANDIESLATVTDTQLDVQERQLDALEKQKEAAQYYFEQEMARLDKTIEQAQLQVDLLNGINTSLMSLPQALNALAASIAAARANPISGGASAVTGAYQQYLGRTPDQNELGYWQGQIGNGVDAVGQIKGSNEAQIKGLYQSLLGRDVDAEGYSFWMNALNSGAGIDYVKEQIKNSAEYMNNVPAFANGGTHAGGWRIVGDGGGPELENTGPSRIYSNSASRDLFGGMEEVMVEIRDELRALHIDNSNENYTIAKNTLDTKDFLDGAVNGDVPILVQVAE